MKWTGVLKSQDFQSRQSHSPGPQEAKGGFGPGSQITPRHPTGSEARHTRRRQAVQIALREAAEDPLGTKNLQRLTTPVSVIASARGFTGILKAGRPQGNPAFLAEEDHFSEATCGRQRYRRLDRFPVVPQSG